MILLIAALLFLFIFLGLLDLSHEIAMPITMHPRTTLINAKILGNIFLIQLKTGIDEKPRKVRTDQRYQQSYGNRLLEHLRKDNGYNR